MGNGEHTRNGAAARRQHPARQQSPVHREKEEIQSKEASIAARSQALQREQALRAEAEAARERLETMLSSISEAFITFDYDWRCTYINDRAAGLIDVSGQELLGKNLWEFSPEMVGTPFYRQLHWAAKGREPVCFTYFYPPSKRWYENRIYPGKDSLSVFITDVTSRKRAAREQQPFKLISDNANEACYFSSRDGRIKYVNKTCCRWLGYTKEELLKLSIWDIDPLHPPEKYRLFFKQAQTTQVPPFETAHRRKNGTTFPVEVSINYIIEEGSAYLIGIVRDISERKEQERRQHFFTGLNMALRELSDPVEIMRATATAIGRHLRVSRCAYGEIDAEQKSFTIECDYHQHTASVVGTHAIDDSDLGDFSRLSLGHTAAIEDLESGPDRTHLAQSHKAFGVRAQLSVPLIRQGRLAAVFLVHHNKPRAWTEHEVALVEQVAERTYLVLENERKDKALRESEARYRTQAEQLATADKYKNEFLAMLAHELRNPLMPIQNAVDLIDLRAAPLDSKLRWSIDVIARQTAHITRLVDDLLDVARITRGRIELHKEEVDLNNIVAHAIETAGPMIDGNGHRLSVSLPDAPLMLKADAARVSQIITNLLNNAAKYTLAGGEIALSVERKTEQGVIRVRDNGIGIAAEMLPQVFDIFTQVGSSLDRSQGGLGLGLALVQRLSEMHGGSVEVFSEGEGKGTEFVVRLPALHSNGGNPVVEAPAQTMPELRSFRILVVDDNIDVTEGLKLLLTELGHAVETAANGKQALEKVARFQPRIVLLDIGLPGMNGFEVAERLRKQHPGNLLLVALTGYGDNKTLRRARQAGFDHHLLKPGDLDTLEELLASVEE